MLCAEQEGVRAAAAATVSARRDAKLKYAFIFHFFGLLWSNQFIVGLSSVVVAAAVAQFYWASGDTKRCAGSGLCVCVYVSPRLVQL